MVINIKGGMKSDNKCGKGEYIYANGSIYIGDFNNDDKDDKGIMYFSMGIYMKELIKMEVGKGMGFIIIMMEVYSKGNMSME